MTKEKQTAEEDRVINAVALYTAAPEFDERIAREFMGWHERPTAYVPRDVNGDPLPKPDGGMWGDWYDAAGNPVARAGWSPMTDSNAAMDVVRSRQWRANWPNTGILFGPTEKSDVIVMNESPAGLQQLARGSKITIAVCLAAMYWLNRIDQN